MSDGLLMINEMSELQTRLDKAIRQMRAGGIEHAEKDKLYKIALMEEILRLRTEEFPATLINQIAYGKVANERFERGKAEAMYKSSIENVNALKLQMRILDNQISREWGRE